MTLSPSKTCGKQTRLLRKRGDPRLCHRGLRCLQIEVSFLPLNAGLKRLSEAYECLDASRPWLCYWILHSLALLEALPTLDDDRLRDVVDFLRRCQHPEGGFCGGPGQVPHLAPTYAAVNALCTIGTDEALSVINRQTLADFIRKMRDPETGMHAHA